VPLLRLQNSSKGQATHSQTRERQVDAQSSNLKDFFRPFPEPALIYRIGVAMRVSVVQWASDATLRANSVACAESVLSNMSAASYFPNKVYFSSILTLRCDLSARNRLTIKPALSGFALSIMMKRIKAQAFRPSKGI
jgi:hypothetical protein